ncbi:MAG: TolC family protein [Betaproteobacteria bacterium]
MVFPSHCSRALAIDRRARRFTALMLLSALVAGTHANAAEPPLSYAEAVRLAVTRSPQLEAQRAMADAAREMVGPAGELPDPKLKLGLENVPTSGADAWTLTRDFMTMQKIGLMQEFPREDKRRLRSQRAENEAQRNVAVGEVAQFAIQREAATAWLSRRYAVDAQNVIAELIAEAQLSIASIASAYRAGRAPQTELIAAQAMQVELRNRATEAATQSRRASIALARYISADADRPPGDAPDISRLPFDVARTSDPDLAPEVRLAQAQETMAATEAELARAARQPDWSAELSYAVRGSAYSNMVSLMVSIDLPWSPGTRQDREYAAKLRDLDAARAMREDAKRMRTAEVGSMLAEWESAREQAQRTRSEMLPLAVQRREAALAAYRGGTGALSAVLDARRFELDTRLTLISQEQATAKAWAWLRFAYPVTEKS